MAEIRSALTLRPVELLLPLLLAFSLALLVTLTKPTVGILVTLGTILLLVSFFSPIIGLYWLVFSMLLGPEFLIGGGLGGGSALGRGLTLRLDDFILLLVGFGWLAKVALTKQGIVQFRTPLNRPIIFYVSACILATLIGVLAGRVRPLGGFFFLLKYYQYFFLFFMTFNLVKTTGQIRTLVTASLVTCFLVSLYAISQIPSGERASAPFEGEFGEPNTLGGYLVFLLAIVGGLLALPRAVPHKAPYFVLLFLGVVALQATLSRASFLAAGIVWLGFLGYFARRSFSVTLLMLAVMAAVPLLAPQPVQERILYTFTQKPDEGQIKVGGVRIDTSTSARLYSWKESLGFFVEHPLFGGGVTGAPFMDAMYPKVLVDTGLLGFSAFLILLRVLFRVAGDGYRHTPDPFIKGISLGFLLGTVGLLVHAIGSNTFIIVRIMEPFWLYAALVTRMLVIGQEPEPSVALPPTGRAKPAGGGTMPAPVWAARRLLG